MIILFEAFRDVLIRIEEEGFPIRLQSSSKKSSHQPDSLRTGFLKDADKYLDEFFRKDPLKIALTGEETDLTQFQSLSRHRNDIIASIAGSFESTSDDDLGKIVWAAVKSKLSGIVEQAMEALETSAKIGSCVSGIQAVWQMASQGKGNLLIVENGYKLRGRLDPYDNSLIIGGEPELTSAIDDLVEMVIEKVLENGSRVVFVESGLLKTHDRIVLIE